MPRYVNSRENAERRARQQKAQEELRKWQENKKRNAYEAKEVGGVFIDGQKAYDLEKRAYTCGGMSVSWALIEAGEMVFTGKATPNSSFTKCRGFCEQAHEIYTREIKGLQKYNESKGLNADGSAKIENLAKEGNTLMAYNSFRDFLTDAQDTYRGAKIEATGLFDAWEKAQEAWKKAQNDPTLSREDKIIEEAHFLKAQRAFNEGYQALTSRVNSKKAELRKGLETQVNSHYKTDPSKLDGNTLKLLEMGLMNANDLVNLANENADNMTMLRVIAKFAREAKDDKARGLALQLDKITKGTSELEAFDSLIAIGDRGISTDIIQRRTSDRLFEEYSANYINSVSDKAFNKPVKIEAQEMPQEGATATQEGTGSNQGDNTTIQGLEGVIRQEAI